jgi:hypothetical protein
LERERKLDFRAPQQGAKLPTIGVLGANTRPIDSQRTAALVQRLRELATVQIAGDGFCHDSAKAFAILFNWPQGGKGLNCFSHASLLLL